MALTEFQIGVLRVIAGLRIAAGERYVAGGVALNTSLASSRISHDIDLFHDSEEAVEESFSADDAALQQAGYRISLTRRRPGFIEAKIAKGAESVLLQWVRDSSYRFFPLVLDEQLGLTLHPFDLATNKILALVGRAEPRDWLDALNCHQNLQPLGYLAYAACGKDPGFSPQMILGESRRACRYSDEELETLAFAGERPNASTLSRVWHAALQDASQIVDLLPPERAGCCVLDLEGALVRSSPEELGAAIAKGGLQFRPGSIRGTWPQVVKRA